MITARERKILLFLLQTEERVTAREVAEVLGVSIRTIHRDLKGVEKILYDYHLKLEKKAGTGIRIQGEEADKKKLERLLSASAPKDYTQEERQALILTMLLEAKEPVKQIALANELDVTLATVSNDLDELEEMLSDFHLTLIRKRGYGVEIEGEEANKRSAITFLISKYMDPFSFISLLKENIQNNQVPVISNQLLGLVNPRKLQLIEEAVQSASSDLPYELADSAYVGLVVHLALAMERLQKGEAIKFEQKYLQQIQGTKEFSIAEKIIRELRASLNIDIPDDEIGYITMHLRGAKLREDKYYLLEAESPGLAYQVKQLIAYVNERVHVDISGNSQLLNDLVTHLNPAIYRMQNEMKITNPMIDQIKQDYHHLFELVAEAVEVIFPDIQFPDDEIGYLVLHFAAAILKDENLNALVICSSGIGSAKILATKLMKYVPEIKQIENKSLFEVERKDMDKYDVIISTIPLKELDKKDYIVVSPMLNQAEVHQIKKSIRKKKLNVKNKQHKKSSNDALMELETLKFYTDAILNLLHSFYVEEIRETDSVLLAICRDVEKRRRIKNMENLFRQLREREKKGGLGVPGTKLVLYHTRSEDVFSIHFSIYSLKHPLKVKGMNEEEMDVTTALLMLAPKTARQEELDILSHLSSLVIQEEKAVNLFHSGDEEAIKQYLAERFQLFLHDKKL